MNFHELDNFNLSDTVKYHNRLNRRLWGRDEHLLPDVRDKLLAQGLTLSRSTPDQFAAHIRSEHAKWSKLIKEAGIKAE